MKYSDLIDLWFHVIHQFWYSPIRNCTSICINSSKYSVIYTRKYNFLNYVGSLSTPFIWNDYSASNKCNLYTKNPSVILSGAGFHGCIFIGLLNRNHSGIHSAPVLIFCNQSISSIVKSSVLFISWIYSLTIFIYHSCNPLQFSNSLYHDLDSRDFFLGQFHDIFCYWIAGYSYVIYSCIVYISMLYLYSSCFIMINLYPVYREWFSS